MLGQILKSKGVLAVVSLIVIGTFIFSNATMGYALRPKSTISDSERREDIAKMFGYGFLGGPGVKLAHDKVFKVKVAKAFNEGRAVHIFGHQASEDLYRVAKEFIEKNGEVGTTVEEVHKRLEKARAFLKRVFDADFIDYVVDEIAKINEAEVKDEKALKFLRMIKKIKEISEWQRFPIAKRAIVEDTRFIAFIFGEKGLDPYLFNVGNILSKEYRALVTHIGTFPYKGSENIQGGPRTIYTSLARILGFAEHPDGVKAYQKMMLHEFMDLAYGKHIPPPAEVIVLLNKINAEIDKKYREVIKEVATEVTEEGPVVVSTPKVEIKKYRLINDLGVKETFVIEGQSKVHPEIIKGSGQKVTITIAKADVGSIGGHGTVPGTMLEAVAETWMKAAEEGLVLSFWITRVGDDISVTVSHNKGKDNEAIHETIWNGFVNAAVIAKDSGFYAAGQDLLADAFSGNVRGAGPGVAEMEFLEAGAEVIIIGQADKTAPGAFNKGLWEILFSPNTTWRPLGKGQARDIRVGVLDFDYNNYKGRHIWFTKEDYDDAAWYLGYPDRYTIDRVTLGTGEDFAAVTAQRLAIIMGEIKGQVEYVGKDDPMFMIRSQSAFPAVGEITSAFLKGEYIVPGWMRGSNKGPFFPVALQEAKIGLYDGPPLLSMWSFNLNNGRLVGFYDLIAANPAIRYIQDRRAARAVALLEEGFGAGSETSLRLGEGQIEYQKGPKLIEEKLKGRWVEFKDGGTLVDEQRRVDEIHEKVSGEVAKMKLSEFRTQFFKKAWGDLAVFATEFFSDMYHRISDEAIKLHNLEKGKVYPILINYESLLKSPDGMMAFMNFLGQLGEGNIKPILHMNRDDIKPEEVDKVTDEVLAKINEITKGYIYLTRDMFAAVVVGTKPEEVAKQVQEKVGADIVQVIGPEEYVKQFTGVIRIVLDKALSGQMTSVAKALKVATEIIPVIATGGQVTQEQLAQLDSLLRLDASGDIHVRAGAVSEEVIKAAEEFQRQVELEIRV